MPGSTIRPARSAPITARARGGCSMTFAQRTACRIANAASSSSPPTRPSVERLDAILKQAMINGVEGVEIIDGAAARRLEPALACVAAMCSPETGIIDSHRYMLALQGDLEDRGGMVAFNTPIERLRPARGGWEVAFRRRRSAIDHGRRGGQLRGARRADAWPRRPKAIRRSGCRGWCSPRAITSATAAGRRSRGSSIRCRSPAGSACM